MLVGGKIKGMKKTTSAGISLIISFGFAMVCQGATYSFSKDLQVGNTGGDVSSLQSFLIEKGFTIPSIASGAVPKGIFGRETKAAVQAFQGAHKLPRTGFVGPLTRGVINNGGTVATTPVPNAPQNPAQITTPGVSGSLALTLQATPSNGTNWGKSQQSDIASYKVQGGSSDMSLNSVQLDFNTRLWLYASSISILDGSNIIGQVSPLSQGNFSELVSGSSYRINVPVTLIIPKGSVKYLTVHVVGLPVSDRSSGILGLTRIQTRAVDGTGVTDTQTVASTRTFQYTGNGNGSIISYADPQSPPNMTATISTAGPTDNIVLGVVDFKSEARDGIIRKMTLYMNANFDVSSTAITTVLDDVKIQSGNLVYSADTIGGVADYQPGYGIPVTFTNLAIPLPKDSLVPVALMVKVKQSTNHSLDGKAASTTLIATGTDGGTDNNPVVETQDDAHTTMAVNTAPLLSSDITFTASNSSMDYTAPVVAKLGPAIVSNGTTVAYPVTFGFSITAGDNTLYISADPSRALATSSVGLANNSLAQLPLGGVTATPAVVPGDSNVSSVSGYYTIPPGSTRTFTFGGSIRNTGGTSGQKTFEIDNVLYGTTTSALTANSLVYYNYGALKVTPTF
jgi:peptidoglycan hydrolase-like protein with peptidoglycan-binding domain